jgi:4-aminobutyrate aminotransferase-like enzyme
LLSIQLKDADKVKQVIAKALEKGLLIDWFLYAPDRIRIAPPLTIREDEIKRVCDILNQALNA